MMRAYHLPKGFATTCGYVLAQPATVNKHVCACFFGARGQGNQDWPYQFDGSDLQQNSNLHQVDHPKAQGSHSTSTNVPGVVVGTLQDPLDGKTHPWRTPGCPAFGPPALAGLGSSALQHLPALLRRLCRWPAGALFEWVRGGFAGIVGNPIYIHI